MVRWIAPIIIVVTACDGACVAPPDAGSDPGPADPSSDAASAPARFVMMGDTGTGEPAQLEVAAAISALCGLDGCDFVVLLGDNIYPDGVDGVDDPAWQDRFELPYQGIAKPFHAILGNHDYGRYASDRARAHNQIAYSAYSQKWHMPAEHYTLRAGPVGLVMIDTQSIILDEGSVDDERPWWPEALAAVAGSAWVIAAGHQPYLSNGHHGSAADVSPDLQRFFEDFVCGKVDLLVAGHDHDREWIDEPGACGGTELLISGAGGSVRAFERDDASVWWHDDDTPGFLYIVADEHRLVARFVDADGIVAYERTLTK